ncbi:MAG: M1 family peptidase, partial [Bacteroidia bacterium]|nr:M1 family peptidase [Bacteroidia bacterium]
MKYLKSLILLLIPLAGFGQHTYWQQHADYTMDLVMDVESFQFSGTQKLTYTNNSPDTLDRVFYHMYFNAFQPKSEMDIRLQSIKDPDRRMYVDGASKIADLKDNEIGFLRATAMDQ